MAIIPDLVSIVLSNPFVVLQIFISLFLAYLPLRYLYNISLHPLSSYPGPRLWAASRLPNAYYTTQGTLCYKLARIHAHYGPIVRVGPNEISYTCAEAWPEIYSAKADMKKVPFHMDTPRNMKGLLSHSFSERALREQEVMMVKYFDMLVQRLGEKAGEKGGNGNEGKKGEKVDICSWYNFTTFDIIGDLTFGESFGGLRDGVYHEWITIAFSYVKGSLLGATAIRFLPKFLIEIGPYLIPAYLRKKIEAYKAFTKDRLMRRIDMKESRPDFLTPVLQTLNTPQGLTLEQLQFVSEVLVIAGSETTATLLTGLTYHLLTMPTILSKLCTEIRSTFSSDSEINMTSVNKLKYELAVIEEGLRMFPPVPFTNRRIVGREGKEIVGRWVPPGTMVGVQQWSAYLSERNFVDADRFCPERWLNNGGTKYKDDKRGVVNAFSMGPRSCLGMTLAYAEMKVILARVFYNYDMELCKESQGWKDGLRMYGLWAKKPLMVMLKKVDRN